MLLKRSGYITSEESFFKSMVDRAKEMKGRLNHITTIEGLVGFDRREVIDFYGKFVIPLRDAKQVGQQIATTKDDKDVFREMLSDQKQFERRFTEAKESLIVGARQLADLQPQLLEDGLVQVMDSRNDEVIRRIRRKLKLS